MFILRIIEETREHENAPFEQVIENHELGNSYCHLVNGITTEFKNIMKDEYPEYTDDDKKNILSIIKGENGITMFCMKSTENKTYSYFIMTETGKTFEKLR